MGKVVTPQRYAGEDINGLEEKFKQRISPSQPPTQPTRPTPIQPTEPLTQTVRDPPSARTTQTSRGGRTNGGILGCHVHCHES